MGGKIIFNPFKKDKGDSDIKEQLNEAFNSIKQEFEDHLDAINENTNELQANYQYLLDLDKKISKLSERLDQIQLFIEKSTGKKFESSLKAFSEIEPLSIQEKQVFLFIYTLKEGDKASYAEIATNLNMTESLARTYITSMIEKGIPITKEYINSKPYICLSSEFKDIQAKKDIINLKEKN